MAVDHADTCPFPWCPGGCDALECPGCGIPMVAWPEPEELGPDECPALTCMGCGHTPSIYGPPRSSRRRDTALLPGWGWRQGWADGGEGVVLADEHGPEGGHLWRLPTEAPETAEGLMAEVRWRRLEAYNERAALIEQAAWLDGQDAITAEMERRAVALAELAATDARQVAEMEHWLGGLGV